MPKLQKTCLLCSKNFIWDARPSRVKAGWGKFCSNSCRSKYYIRRTKIWEHLRGKKSWNNNQKKVTCDACGKEFLTSSSNRNYKRKFCSRKCFGTAVMSWTKPFEKGVNNLNWKGGVTQLNELLRGSSEYQRWRAIIFKRDNYTCQICGQRGRKIEANHIKTFSEYSTLRLEETNGITLCKNCHCVLVNKREKNWESYFYFNLETRGYLESEFIPKLIGGKFAN